MFHQNLKTKLQVTSELQSQEFLALFTYMCCIDRIPVESCFLLLTIIIYEYDTINIMESGGHENFW